MDADWGGFTACTRGGGGAMEVAGAVILGGTGSGAILDCNDKIGAGGGSGVAAFAGGG